ncbi:MAG: nucleotidyltransferase domain-containing protein [Chitinophagaceae bacterium]|nr:nucleotidyltransferase domain-containing protein [Chitinophagaceae bacterium]
MNKTMIENNQISKEIKSAVFSIDQRAEVILFGSRAQGDFKNDSDWDVLILVDENEANFMFKKKIRNKLFNLQLEFNQIITGIIRNKNIWKQLEHTPLYREIKRDGIAL